MDTTKHDIHTLFAQLGLPNSESQIDQFIACLLYTSDAADE